MSILKSKQLTGSLNVTSSWAVTSSYALNGGTGVSYITASGPFSLTGIEVADYSTDVAVTFVNNTLKFIFGTPAVPSTPILGFNNTFLFDRFNKVLDTYDLSGSFAVNGYTLVSASLYTGSVLIDKTGTGTTLRTQLTTSGSQTYRLEVTASSPLDGTLNRQSFTLPGPLNKTLPTAPSLVTTPQVQLGVYNTYNIEQGATGSISLTAAYGTSNGWVQAKLTTSSLSPVYVTGSATGSAAIIISATASYSSSGVNGSDNNPVLVTASFANDVYPKIISLRYGTADATSFTQTQLENLALWDTSLGGTIGTIVFGTQNPSGENISLIWSGAKYQYIISEYYLTQINTQAGNVLNNSGDPGAFSTSPNIVGPYIVYRTNAKQAYPGQPQLYGLV